ncbi:MAG: helix-turn-helix domain-containing protein [Bilophila wadsworthia]
MKPSNPSRVLTLERGLQILEYIVERRNVTVTNVATAFGIQKSASHRFLNTLKYMGYVEQTPQSDYALTGRLRYLAEGVVPRIEVRNLRGPILRSCPKPPNSRATSGTGWREITYLAQRSSIRRSKGMPRATVPRVLFGDGSVLAFTPRRGGSLCRTDAVHPVHGKDHLRSRYVFEGT